VSLLSLVWLLLSLSLSLSLSLPPSLPPSLALSVDILIFSFLQGYVQGINDLVTPFFFVFLMEITGENEEAVASGRVMSQVTPLQLKQVIQP
jgi:hypothetical protein